MTDYLVLGAGAIGGSLAHHLASTGHSVTVVDADAAHVAAIRENGLVLVDPVTGAERAAAVAAACTPDEASAAGALPRRVILATKSHHVASAAAWLATVLPEEGTVLLCQNGDTYALAAPALGADRVLTAFINFAADVVGPGRIRTGGPGAMAIGERRGAVTPRVRDYVRDLEGFGEVVASDNVAGYIWAKRGVGNIFAAASLADEHISVLIDDYREVMSAVATEIYAIAERQGIALEPFDGIEVGDLVTDAEPQRRKAAFDRMVRFTAGLPGKERSGVFRDIAIRKRPSEARPELRSLAQDGERYGIPTPHLEALERVLAGLESGEREFGRDNYSALAGID
jgi:2-dehydropantoate 2-reductase